MSNSFIGLTMLVTLNSPPGAQLRGVVSGIEPGKSLTLKNVTCPMNGKYVPEFTIQAEEIVGLEEAGSENATAKATATKLGNGYGYPGGVAQTIYPPPPVGPPPPIAMRIDRTPVSGDSSTFEDPAILSVGKRPTPVSIRHAQPPRSDMGSRRADSAREEIPRNDRPYQDPVALAAAKMVESMHKLGAGEDSVDDGNYADEGLIFNEPEDMPSEVVAVKQDGPINPKIRKQRKTRNVEKQAQESPAKAPGNGTKKSKGWRETPLLTESFQPFTTLNKNARRNRKDESGWGTEDATDVQDMGDFDFEGGNAKFDKHTVFNQIQAEDNVADEDRLVYHNRIPKAKPGTGGGKNLHHTENVLDGPPAGTSSKKNDSWKSEAGESELDERTSQRDSANGRLQKRADSKLSLNRHPISRKGSSTNTSGQRTMSIPVTASKPAFFLVPSDRRCEPISALQMLNLENIADNELGLSEDMMAENAGRGVAEVVLSSLVPGGGGLVHVKKPSPHNVIVLAGNNKSSIRAISAARHIGNHGMNVIVCLLGLDREGELLAGLKRQIKVFRNFGGKIVAKNEFMEYLKTTNGPVELIIDALLGLTMPFEELRRGDQAAAFELMEWANRGKAPVLAIDVPSGIDPTSGKVSVIDGRKLYIHAQFVVAMGAPQKGLLDAMALGEGVVDEDADVDGEGEGVGARRTGGREWNLFVVDLGLGAAAWKKAGTKVRRGVEFEGSWVVGMRFQGGAE